MKKSILSLALAVLMVMTLFTVGAFAEGEMTAEQLQRALNDAASSGNKVVTMTSDVIVSDADLSSYGDAAIKVPEGVTLDGGNYKIIAENWTSTNRYHVVGVSGTTSSSTTTIENLTVIGNANTKSGVHAFACEGNVVLNNVIIKNCGNAAVQVNGSVVEATALVTSGNVWGAVNVDKGSASTKASFTLNSGDLGENVKIWTELVDEENVISVPESWATINGETVNSFAPFSDLGDGVVYNENKQEYYSGLKFAVEKAEPGDVITVMPGTHKLADDETITINKQITIRGAGESTVISGSGTTDYGLGLFTFNAGSEGSVIEDLTINYTASGAQRSAVYFNYGFEGSADNVTKIKNVHFKGADSLENIMSQKAIAIGSTYIDGGYIEISGCTIENFAYGMYFNAVRDLAITGNTINGTKYNGINIAGDGNIACENINIAGNTLTNIAAANYDSDLYSSGISIGQNSSDIDIADNAISMLNGKPGIYFVPKTDGTPAGYVVTILDGKNVIDQIAVSSDNNTIILPDAPKNSGYIFLGWRCGDATYKEGETVTVNSDMTFTAVWGNLPDVDPEDPEEPEVPDFPFYDVNIRDWYYDAVYYVWDKGLMDGIDVGVFAPNATLTRAMVWTIIARAEGVDTTGGSSWYAKAQEWVVAKGISDGENPSAAITRQELVTMLYRLAGEPTVSGSITAPDAASVSAWASDAMVWAMNIGLIEGDENGAVTPTATATRAQAAAIFMRYIEA